jgi:DNA-binding protein HU-beta
MNKTEFAKFYSEKQGISQKESLAQVEGLFEGIREALEVDGKVTISSELEFNLVPTEAREARNPSTGKTVQVAAGRKLKIKPLKNFKDLKN